MLPHEVTHVILADLFPTQQIPRWADEGIAVLSEPTTEQRLRAADLDEPLSSGTLFKVESLMAMDYPDGRYWGLYYAQSVSLTRFLVEQGTPAQFIQFVQGAQRRPPESELRGSIRSTASPTSRNAGSRMPATRPRRRRQPPPMRLPMNRHGAEM